MAAYFKVRRGSTLSVMRSWLLLFLGFCNVKYYILRTREVPELLLLPSYLNPYRISPGEPADAGLLPAAAVRGRAVLAQQQREHVRALHGARGRAAQQRGGMITALQCAQASQLMSI